MPRLYLSTNYRQLLWQASYHLTIRDCPISNDFDSLLRLLNVLINKFIFRLSRHVNVSRPVYASISQLARLRSKFTLANIIVRRSIYLCTREPIVFMSLVSSSFAHRYEFRSAKLRSRSDNSHWFYKISKIAVARTTFSGISAIVMCPDSESSDRLYCLS